MTRTMQLTTSTGDLLTESLDWNFDPKDPDDCSGASSNRFIDQTCYPFPKHIELAEAFTTAGFHVIRVERLWCANVWNLSLERGTSNLPVDYRSALRHLRQVLERHGVPIDRDTPSLRMEGDRFYVAFRWAVGEVGAVVRRRAGGWNFVRTRVYEPETLN